MTESTSKSLTITAVPNADFTEYFIDSIRCPEQKIQAVLYEISAFLGQKKQISLPAVFLWTRYCTRCIGI